MPLQWCCGPGVRLDFRALRGRGITPEDLQAELARSGAPLGSGTIPLIWCGVDEQIDDPAKLRGASAGWVRPVARVPEGHFAAVHRCARRG